MPNTDPAAAIRKPARTPLVVVRYLLLRIISISLTIVIGVFITVWIVNGNNAIDKTVQRQIDDRIKRMEREGISIPWRKLRRKAPSTI